MVVTNLDNRLKMTDAEWEPFKLEIERLYCHENKKLREVMQFMASTYALDKSYVLWKLQTGLLD